MLTIDLLKGQGVPIRSRPEGITILGITVVVPLAIAAMMVTCYLSKRITISAHEREITRYKTSTDKLSDAIAQHKSSLKEKSRYISCLSEIKSAIRSRTQWSPVLATVVENMPESVVLTELEVTRRFVKKSVPKKGDPKQKVQVSIPASTLKMTVMADAQPNCDEMIRSFKDRLVQSDLLGPKLENIRVSHKSRMVDGNATVCYEMDCLFKPES